MANTLSNTGITDAATIKPEHVSQSVDAFTGAKEYDITLSGSSTITGSLNHSGSSNQVGNYIITGSITASSAILGVSSGYTGSLPITTPLVVQNSSNAYIGIFSPTESVAGIYMGSSADTFGASIVWGYDEGKLTIGTRQINQGIDFLIGNKNQSSLSLTPVSTNLTNHNSVLTLTGSFIHGTGSDASALDYSHAEGRNTNASGFGSHAEGLASTSEGDYSHAEGRNTIASGSYSHAEGRDTNAEGAYSHAEGYLSTASGIYSHASGLGTVTNANYQYTVGQYNISSSDPSSFIVGNGVDANNRSNILFVGNSKIELNSSVTASAIISSSNEIIGRVLYADTLNGNSAGLTISSFTCSGNITGSSISRELSYHTGSFEQLKIIGEISSSGDDATQGNPVTINNLLRLTPRTVTPHPTNCITGSIMLSGSGATLALYVYIGGAGGVWNKVDWA